MTGDIECYHRESRVEFNLVDLPEDGFIIGDYKRMVKVCIECGYREGDR
tara:strand:+ start:1363 stop:1509 length:147 start_codon:yes stop_codon:yes gene_type:complete